MRALGLRGFTRMGFFWKKQGKKKNPFDELEQYIRSAPSIKGIVDNIKKTNQNKPLLLPPQLPQHKGKLTVVMELDQVLSYTFTPDQQGYLLSPLRKHDYYTQYQQYNACLSIYKRKNLENFLNYVSQQCQPVLWSTGVKSYVELMLKFIDPQKKIPYVLTQESCNLAYDEKQQIDMFLKDLQLLGRDMSRVIYFDSKPLAFWLNPDNGIPLQEFRADSTMQTQDLNMLILQLEELKEDKDIRPSLIQRFQIRKILQESKLL